MAKRGGADTWLWVALGGAAAFLIFSQRKSIMLYGAKALEEGNELLFKASLPDHVDPYSDLILLVAHEKRVDPFLIFGLGERESLWGTSRFLSPVGPEGTGDAGHGHGIMQIDDRSWGAWLASHDWTDPYTNVSKGVDIYKGKLSEITAAPSGAWVIDATTAKRLGVKAGTYPALAVPSDIAPVAALAAYNAGAGAVRRAYSAAVGSGLDPLTVIDNATTGSDYSAAVWATMTDAATVFEKLAS